MASDVEEATENEPKNPIKFIPKEELEAEYKKTKQDFEVFVKNHKFPEDITKSGKKKLIKKLQFEFLKQIRRKMEKEKHKRKRASREPGTIPKRRKLTKMSDSTSKIKIAVDCSFDDLMVERDIQKLSKQIQRCYTLNRHMESPLQLYYTQVRDKTLDRLESAFDGYTNWDVHIKSESLPELFTPADIVYLCAESDNLLTEFDDKSVYVIGGFVDHNLHKGLAYDRAVEAGFRHARLPIDSFFTMATRRVLTVCHVFEIISNFCETGSWKAAIEKTIPVRSGLKAKSAHNGDEEQTETAENDQKL